jgi:hypothetical protein
MKHIVANISNNTIVVGVIANGKKQVRQAVNRICDLANDNSLSDDKEFKKFYINNRPKALSNATMLQIL